MKLAITGATGFLGKATAGRLFQEGHTVHATGRNPKLAQSLIDLGISFSPTELDHLPGLLKAFEGAETVIHCAALSTPWGKPSEFERVNIRGTQRVIEACQKAGVRRLIHISTPSIYVDLNDREMIQEEDPLPPRSINDYARTKREAEKLVFQAGRAGLEVILLRPQGIFGPGDTSIFPRLVRVAERGVIPIIGSGQNQIDMTYVDNVVEAILCSVTAPQSALNRAYNITNGEPIENYPTLLRILKELGHTVRTRNLSFGLAYSLAGVLEGVARLGLTGGKEPLLTRYTVCALSKTRTLSIEAARRNLGYRPKTSMEEGFQRAIRWWKETHGS